MDKRTKDNKLKETKSDFLDSFEEWHDRKYNDEYRYKNKLPFYYNKNNYLKIGFLSLLMPLLCLALSIILNLETGFYMFFLLACFPGIRLIVKYYNSK